MTGTVLSKLQYMHYSEVPKLVRIRMISAVVLQILCAINISGSDGNASTIVSVIVSVFASLVLFLQGVAPSLNDLIENSAEATAPEGSELVSLLPSSKSKVPNKSLNFK